MLKNYVLVAFRELWKSLFFSSLNILGLGISISACLLVIMLVRDAHDFDRFHPLVKDTYRVLTHAVRKGGGSEPYATSPFSVSTALKAQSPLVQNWVPLVNRFSGELIQNDNRFRFSGLATTPAFFELFGFSLSSGSTDDLKLSQVIYLTAPLAKKLFPGIDPTGKTIQWAGHSDPLKIAGVLNEFPGKTHLEFEALTSIETILADTNAASFGFDQTDWTDYYSCYNFYQLTSSKDKSTIEDELNEIGAEHYAHIDLESRDAGYRFELQPLDQITPGRMLSNSMGRGLPSVLLWFLSFLGLIIIVSAGFNHTNISLAKAVSRAREIGIRKVTGASRLHIFMQFIVEALWIAIISTGIGFLALKLLIPIFRKLSFLNFLDVNLDMKVSLYAWYLGFALFVGILIGVLPALLISKINTLKSMQQTKGLHILKHLSLRKIIIVSQLCMTLLFFFMITVAFQQTKYSLRTNFAANRDYTINLDLQGLEFQKVKNELSKLATVSSISGSSMRMGTYRDSKIDVKLNDTGEAVGVRDYIIDDVFIPDFDLQLLNGKNFEANPNQTIEREVIVNESFLQVFNLGDAEDAVGKGIYIDTQLVSITGVVKDFRFKPADYAIEPLLLRYRPSSLNVMHVNMHRTSDLNKSVQELKSIWQGLDRFHPMQWSFYSDDIKAIYDSMRDMIWVISFFALLAAVISLMGLLGMVAYIVAGKRKEIAIRKVVGAKLDDLYWTLSRSYLNWLMLSLIIAIPLASILCMFWLRTFAFRIHWSPFWFVPGLLVLGSCVLLVISFQVIKASVSNPVLSLRNE